jgi:lysophospholipase L1-like esterase
MAIAQSPTSTVSDKPFYLHDGDTVVFYGDSITEQMYYTHWVELYTATRFPHMHVTFYNAGVGGDRVSGGGAGPVDLRLTRDVFAKKPTVVTIMLGMNDGSYTTLTPAIESTYHQGYEHILTSIQQSFPSARITLLGPSPFDEVSRPPNFPGGYNPTLIHFSDLDEAMATKFHSTFIDLNAPFVAAIKRGIAINPVATELLLPDRVHPEMLGHWFMAAAILKGWNAPSLVTSTSIDAEKLGILDQKNTHISALAGDATSIHWTQLDEALPLPLSDDNAGLHFLRQLTDIEEELNQQPLKITGLKPGNYQLSIDNSPMGTFTSLELENGVNLADLRTPMRGQSDRVGWTIRDREYAHYVRYRILVEEMNSGQPRPQAEEELTKFEDAEQKHIEELAQPTPHQFALKAIEALK